MLSSIIDQYANNTWSENMTKGQLIFVIYISLFADVKCNTLDVCELYVVWVAAAKTKTDPRLCSSFPVIFRKRTNK